MAVNILDVGASVPSSRLGETFPIPVPNGSEETIASFSIELDMDAPANNRVEVNATVGVGATLSIPQVVFRIYRDGNVIFRTQQGMQNAAEQFYTVKMTAVDFNVPQGSHEYTLTVERTTPNDTASVAGPITFGGVAFGPIN